MLEKLWYLKRCDLFERLTPNQLQHLESRSRARSFLARSTIYLPADEGNAVFLLTSGRAKMTHLTVDGKESILAFIEPGELFGELAVIEPAPRDEYVVCIEPCTVVMIPVEEMKRLMDEHPEVSLGITKLIGLRRRRIERRLKNLLFLSNHQRLCHLLLDLAERYGSPNGEGTVLTIKLSHQDLANVIGSTRETVTVLLGQLRARGLINSTRQRIVLIKPQQLADAVDRPMPQFSLIAG